MDLFREALLHQRSEILASLGSRLEIVNRRDSAAADDEAQICHDQFLCVRLRDLAFDKLRQIDEALARLTRGNYGICRECGDLMPLKRLMAIPWARYCVECQDTLAPEAGPSEPEPLFEWPPAA